MQNQRAHKVGAHYPQSAHTLPTAHMLGYHVECLRQHRRSPHAHNAPVCLAHQVALGNATPAKYQQDVTGNDYPAQNRPRLPFLHNAAGCKSPQKNRGDQHDVMRSLYKRPSAYNFSNFV